MNFYLSSPILRAEHNRKRVEERKVQADLKRVSSQAFNRIDLLMRRVFMWNLVKRY